MYSPQLLDHFEHPRNAGELADADARVRVENPACGDILELAVKVEGNCIQEIRFLAKGCVPAMACGSLITEMAAERASRKRDPFEKKRLRSRLEGFLKLRDTRRNWPSMHCVRCWRS